MYWPAINSIILLCISIIIILAFSQVSRVLARKQTCLDTLEAKIDDLNEQLITYEHVTNRQQQQIAELNKNLTACFTPLENFESRIEEVASSVQLLQSNIDSESTEQKLYGRAKKMIEMGADIDELVIECEIPRAEAELLLSIYKS
jgi:chromosome segregation ATPase